MLGLFSIPFFFSLICFLLPAPRKILKIFALLLSLFPLGFLVFRQEALIDSTLQLTWLPTLGIEFHLKMDSIALLFVYLTALIIPVSILATESGKLHHPNIFYGLALLLQGLLIGFFTARDLALFTIFFEGMLLPLYFMINIWGGHKRQNASLKFIIYMFAGSALLIAAVLALYLSAGTFNLDVLKGTASSVPFAAAIAAVFLLAFAVKTPLFPFHAWLPDAYTQASTSGSILLSALLSKAGIYGIFRILLELFPTLLKEWSPLLLALAIVGVFYGGLAAWIEKDYKRLIAYSSFAHVNFILAGLFIWSQPAQSGAILQAINHGITIAALFLVAGWLETRLGTTSIGHVGGLCKFMPHLCWLTVFFVMASVALPGTNNFVGELMILFGLFRENPWLAAVLTLTVILSAMYMLRWVQKVYFEAPGFHQETWIDIRAKEFAIAFPLVALILWIGLYPAPLLNKIEPTAENLEKTG